ncbi:MAG: radical SAM protein [Ruminococcaceae bacterium]|nr:radical SAM protein [Oscillospiraceae bacterium]
MARVIRATTEKRRILGELIPLSVPFTCSVGVTNVCNFKCKYCPQSVRPAGVENRMMAWDIYQKLVDDLTEFPEKLKLLMLSGLGEPLLHPRIADMVAYAKEKQVAETVRIITNASVLTHELSDKLIDAGLDHLKVSIQGLDDEGYQSMSRAPVPFARILDNLAYFFEHKKDTVVNVKIVSDAFKTSGDEQRFYEMFGGICDVINIEHISQYQELVDYSQFMGEEFVSQVGNTEGVNSICQAPFYFFAVFPDGEIVPCHHITFDQYKMISMGNVADVNLAQWWNSERFNRFRLKLLRNERSSMPLCTNCRFFQAECHPEDNIDNYADQLIEKYEKIIKAQSHS